MSYAKASNRDQQTRMISAQEYKQAVKEYTRNIFRFLFKSLKDEEAVNDIVQDCYMKLWQNREKIDPRKVKSWLFAVAHNGMINYLKSISRKVQLDENTPIPQEFQGHEFDTKALLERVLNTLSPLQKSILLLRDLEGYEYKEIGEILGLNESQVKVYLFRARQKVKDSIKQIANVL